MDIAGNLPDHGIATFGDEIRERTESRLKRYHDVAFDDVLEAIDWLAKPGDTIICGGSLVFGLGNRLSDLDILFVGDQEWGNTRVPLEHFVNTLRVDSWRATRPSIDEMFALAEGALQSDAPLQGLFGDVHRDEELQLMHRIAFGIVLRGEANEQHEARGRLAQRIAVREFMERCRHEIFLAQVSAKYGRRYAAVLASRRAVEDAVNAQIYSDAPFSQEKWLVDLVAGRPDLASRYEPFRSTPDLREHAEFTKRATDVCEDLIGTVLDLKTLSSQCAWTGDLPQVFPIGSGHSVVGLGDGTHWPIEEREFDALNRLLAHETKAWEFASCDEDEGRLCFELFERGLIDLTWHESLSHSGPEEAGSA
ncbi:MAG: hypothetical protein ACRDKI_09955 [Solirubrobacterales bacterium]